MDRMYWIDSNGTEYELNDVDFRVLDGMNGRFMPPISFIEEEVPFQHGTKLRQVKVNARDVDIPLYIETNSPLELRKTIRNTLKMFNPLKGDGKLRSIAPDGSQRELYCRYSTGLEGNEDNDSKGTYWQKVILVFRAFDPYWYDTITRVETFTTGKPATFFPFFPLRLSSSSVFADATIDNTGDVETYPEWIIQGPGENIVIRNQTTRDAIFLATFLQEGESIIIDTHPKRKTVKKGDGSNLFAAQTEESSLWPLQEGINNIRIEMGNATSASSVQISYRNRYWGP
ncbi:phage tail domain-containing protein [Metabacillus halosaccharovorans]|uniref:phage distal tail protein n=1 Tax=Metabacillus halosaccharovorans TaxID=930124 RepID=UPI0034CD1E92